MVLNGTLPLHSLTLERPYRTVVPQCSTSQNCASPPTIPRIPNPNRKCHSVSAQGSARCRRRDPSCLVGAGLALPLWVAINIKGTASRPPTPCEKSLSARPDRRWRIDLFPMYEHLVGDLGGSIPLRSSVPGFQFIVAAVSDRRPSIADRRFSPESQRRFHPSAYGPPGGPPAESSFVLYPVHRCMSNLNMDIQDGLKAKNKD